MGSTLSDRYPTPTIFVQRSMTLLRHLLLIAANVVHSNLLSKMALRDTHVNASCSYQVVTKQRTTSSI